MKKIYTLAAILLTLFAVQVNAQVTYGINAGVTHSSWKGDALGNLDNLLNFSQGMITTQPKNGIYAGGFMEMPLGGVLSIQPDVYYSQKGYTMKGQVLTDKL